MNKRRIQRQKWLKCRASCISLLLVFGLLLSNGVIATHVEPVFAASSIDWSEIPSYSGAANVTNWSVAKGDGGYYFYVIGNQYTAGEISVKNADGSDCVKLLWSFLLTKLINKLCVALSSICFDMIRSGAMPAAFRFPNRISLVPTV